jgi:hypothetical protein
LLAYVSSFTRLPGALHDPGSLLTGLIPVPEPKQIPISVSVPKISDPVPIKSENVLIGKEPFRDFFDWLKRAARDALALSHSLLLVEEGDDVGDEPDRLGKRRRGEAVGKRRLLVK